MVTEVCHRLLEGAQVPDPQPPLVAAARQRVRRQHIPRNDVHVCLLGDKGWKHEQHPDAVLLDAMCAARYS